MGNYEQLKQSVSNVIKTNGNQEITGSILQNVLLTIISTVGANATFAGIATPATNPGTPDGPVFWIASESGAYSNFGGVELQDGLSVLMWNGSWSSQQIFGIDDEPTAGSDNLVKSGGVRKELDSKFFTFTNQDTSVRKALDGILELYIYYIDNEYVGDSIELQRIDRNIEGTGSSIVFWNVTKSIALYITNLDESKAIVGGNMNAHIGYYCVIDWSYFTNNAMTHINIPLDMQKVTSTKWCPFITHQKSLDTLNKDITIIKKDITIIKSTEEDDVDIYNKSGSVFRNSGYISKTDGSIIDVEDYKYTDFIKVNEGDIYNVAIPTQPNQYYWKIAYYDENKDFVSGTDNVGAITIPSGIVYFRCCGGTSDTKSVIYAYNNSILYNLINSNTTKIGAIEEHIQSVLLNKKNLSITRNEYVANNSTGSLSGCCYTNYIPVEPGQVWVIENCYLYAYLCEFYNANKDYVNTGVTTEGSYETYNFTIPSGCYFMRVNVRMQEFDSGQTCFYIQGLKEYAKLINVIISAIDIIGIQSVIKSIIDNDNSVQRQNNHYHNIKRLSSLQNTGGNLIAFGDSITHGYTSESSYSIGNIGKISGEPFCENPYIKIVADGLGKTLISKASSGACATQVSGRSYMYDQIIEAQSLSADVIIVAIGVNDYDVNNNNLGTLLDVVGNSPSTTSFYGEINKEFAKIKELWPNADIICITPIPYLREPHANSLGKFVDALIEMSVIYDFSVICGEKLEFPKSLGVFSNLTLADNLHPTALGHKLMGNGILNLIKQQ